MIGMAFTALLLVLVLRVAVAFQSPELADIAEEEAALDARLEREEAASPEDEEAAAR